MAQSAFSIFNEIKSDIIDLIDSRIKKLFNYGVTIGGIYLSKKEYSEEIYRIFGNGLVTIKIVHVNARYLIVQCDRSYNHDLVSVRKLEAMLTDEIKYFDKQEQL